jgi:uncharacterized protein (DUF58 family)
MTVDLTWGWSAFARGLVVVAALALGLGIGLARPALVVLAAAPLAWFALAGRRHEPGSATVRFEHPLRCFEAEQLSVSVRVELDAPVETAWLSFRPAAGFAQPERVRPVTLADTDQLQLEVPVTAPRWGRHRLGAARVHLWSRSRLRQARLVLDVPGDVAVFPQPALLGHLPVGSSRFDRVGDHPSAAAGSGVEFHGVRRFVAGDRPRRVNWPVTSRRGELHVNEVRDERAVDVVVAVDVIVDTAADGRSSRDLALRGAAGATRLVLQAHDRVGLVAVGGRLRWLRPAMGDRQFYRVVEAMLDVVDWHSFVDPDVESIPYPALPAGAHVIFFSPLVDDRGVGAVLTLRRRGHPVLVIDTCVGEPGERDPVADLGRRLWRLERAATRTRYADLGITVAPWDGTAELDALIAPALRASERAAR